MNNKPLLAVLIFFLALSLTIFLRMQPQGAENTQTTTNSQNTEANSEIPSEVNSPNKNFGITSEQLSEHSSNSDCWVAYDGKVYDITSFLPNHPGSAAAISPYCGTSYKFKEAFESQHGTSKVKNLIRVGVLIGDFDVIGETA